MKRDIFLLVLILFPALLCGQEGYDSILRAVALSGAGKTDEAAGILTNEISTRSDANLFLMRGEVLLKARRIKDARNDFMAAENMKQGSGVYGLARCAALSGDARAAVAYLEIHLRSDKRKSEPEIMLDSAFVPITASPEWKALWKRDWYRGYERKTWEIENYIKSGRTDLAEETLDELSALYPDMPVTDYCRARVLISRGKYHEAAEILSALTSGTDAPVSWQLALADARTGEGNYYASAMIYGKLMDNRYPDPGLLLKRAQMLFKSGDRNAARKDLERYLDLDPDNSEALGLTGKAFAEEGAIFEALPYLNANVEKHPGEASAFSLRGDAWLAARTWDKAAEDYTMSLDLEPDNPTVNLNMGIALINSGRMEDACYYLRKAKSLGEKSASQYLSRYCIK